MFSHNCIQSFLYINTTMPTKPAPLIPYPRALNPREQDGEKTPKKKLFKTHTHPKQENLSFFLLFTTVLTADFFRFRNEHRELKSREGIFQDFL